MDHSGDKGQAVVAQAGQFLAVVESAQQDLHPLQFERLIGVFGDLDIAGRLVDGDVPAVGLPLRDPLGAGLPLGLVLADRDLQANLIGLVATVLDDDGSDLAVM